MIRVKKVKYDSIQVSIEYEEKNSNNKWEQKTLKSFDKPVMDFRKALQSLATYFENICQLPDGYSDTITVRGVSFSFGGPDETIGAVISGVKELNTSNAPLCLNTPHLAAADYNGNENNTKILPSGCAGCLEDLQGCVIAYIEGLREPKEDTINMFETIG